MNIFVSSLELVNIVSIVFILYLVGSSFYIGFYSLGINVLFISSIASIMLNSLIVILSYDSKRTTLYDLEKIYISKIIKFQEVYEDDIYTSRRLNLTRTRYYFIREFFKVHAQHNFIF